MSLFEKATSKKPATLTECTKCSRYTADEYEFLFLLIKNATFKGENLEFIYNLVLKLQEDYVALKKTTQE